MYLPIWLGFTWAELKRETGDERMRPVGHAFSLFVPGYGYWQVHRHFRLIRDVLARAGGTAKVDPLSATLGVDYLIIGASQRTAMAKLLGGSVVTSVAQQLPDSIRLVIFG